MSRRRVRLAWSKGAVRTRLARPKASRTRGDMTQQHVEATCCSHKIMCCSHKGTCLSLRNVTLVSTTCPCYVPLIQVPYVLTTHDFEAATCHWDMSLCHEPSCVGCLKVSEVAKSAGDNLRISG